MDFQHVGRHCNAELCRQKDFLPFTCSFCNLIFCLEHRVPSDHQCKEENKNQKKAIVCPVCQQTIFYTGLQDPNDAYNLHTQQNNCNIQNAYNKLNEKLERKCQSGFPCKELITDLNSFVCKKCFRELCLKHRYDDKHECFIQKQDKQRIQVEEKFYKANQQINLNEQEQKIIQQNINRKPPQTSNVHFKELDKPVCHVCGKSFDTYEILISHAETTHELQKNKQTTQKQLTELCEMCDCKFSEEQQLIEHVLKIHFNK